MVASLAAWYTTLAWWVPHNIHLRTEVAQKVLVESLLRTEVVQKVEEALAGNSMQLELSI